MDLEILEHTIYLDCPNCGTVEEGQEPTITAAALVDDTEAWVSLLCPICEGMILLVVQFEPRGKE